jgi:hypothetical protein
VRLVWVNSDDSAIERERQLHPSKLAVQWLPVAQEQLPPHSAIIPSKPLFRTASMSVRLAAASICFSEPSRSVTKSLGIIVLLTAHAVNQFKKIFRA